MKKNCKKGEKDMQKFNYHGHTARCGHAEGSDEAYVVKAIENDFKWIGFSDHAPYHNGYQEGYRMDEKELDGYVESIKQLQKKYEDDITIRIGLEIEYFENQIEELKKYKERFDYLILGQHGPALFATEYYDAHSDADVLTYASLIKKACEAGLPDIIAHPDLYMFGKEEWNDACIEAAHTICKAAQDYHILLEINLNGLKYGKRKLGEEYRYTYPYRKFWEVAALYDIDVCYGLDAHSPEKYADEECFRIVDEEILKGINLRKIKQLEIPKKL